MDRGVLRALAAMYRQLRRCFKIVGCCGAFFAATNGILQGCPMSVICINLLTSVWMRAVDHLGQPVTVTVRALPPLLQVAAAQPGQLRPGLRPAAAAAAAPPRCR